MALHWFIDSRKRLIIVTAEGSVSRAEIDGLLEAVTAIGARVRSLHAGSVRAVALVLPNRLPRDGEPDDAPTLVARLIGILASAERPLRLFKSVPAAKRWLDSLTVPVA